LQESDDGFGTGWAGQHGVHGQIPEVTQKMLTQQLRQLETDGLVRREVFPQVPPKVVYSLTATGEELSGLLVTLSKWATAHMPALEAGRRKQPSGAKN
jgi:DNA-binding HxlR family transcriptional regulator